LPLPFVTATAAAPAAAGMCVVMTYQSASYSLSAKYPCAFLFSIVFLIFDMPQPLQPTPLF
jgi:hypothetical protein